MLKELIELANGSTPEKRHQLVEHVTDLFINGADSYQTEEITLFNTLLENMLPTMEAEQKQKVSEQLAPIPSTSHDLAVSLAGEQIEIARPMLTQSEVLKNEDILKLAKTMGQSHLLAISQRKHLESNVTDVLLERGEQPVKRSVAANTGAEISDWGSRLLVKLAESDDQIRDSMMERSDITEAELEKLINQMPGKQQDAVRLLRKQNEDLVNELFQKASRAVAATKLERKATRIDAKVMLKDIRAEEMQLGQAITQLALSNNLFDICFLLSELSGLEQKYVTNVMVRYDATGIAVLCKSLGITDNEYSAVCKAKATHNKQPATTVNNWIADYQTLSDRDARRLLSFMKIRLSTLEEQAA
ncbi:DUF2336 domain-containing protein [Roseibium sp.]|uniref:DUF2336 domain-containing protein n=1 Tax=Roseibium sp. TaxID=1936156 RepID=UPI003B527FC3